MAQYIRKDHYYKKAKKEGAASRAIYKLDEIDRQFSLVKKGDAVVDFGSAPGGWLQYAAQKVGSGGKVIGVDLKPLPIPLPPSANFIQGDATSPEVIEKIFALTQNKIDLFLSDISPNLSGIHFKDCHASFELASKALELARAMLKKGGHFLVKIFPGEETQNYLKELKKSFEEVKQVIPDATRKGSSEIYLIGKKFK